MPSDFETQLTGGHPNSLGNTVAVVETVLARPDRFEELFQCYFSTDEVVRLRTSSAVKRVAKAQKDLVLPYVDRLLNDISKIDQASTQWTLAQLFDLLASDLSEAQQAKSLSIMQHNLAHHHDWIVLNTTMDVLGGWSKHNPDLKKWLQPHLQRLTADNRKSVARKATKWLDEMK